MGISFQTTIFESAGKVSFFAYLVHVFFSFRTPSSLSFLFLICTQFALLILVLTTVRLAAEKATKPPKMVQWARHHRHILTHQEIMAGRHLRSHQSV
jgi:hypothetical protein